MNDITNSMQEKDFSDLKPAEELLENPAFQFLQDWGLWTLELYTARSFLDLL